MISTEKEVKCFKTKIRRGTVSWKSSKKPIYKELNWDQCKVVESRKKWNCTSIKWKISACPNNGS